MSKVNTAVIFSTLGQYATQVISFITIVVLARILSPAEIGMYAIAASTILIAGELRSFGVTQYLVREKELSREKIQAVLGMTVGISWSLGLLVIVAAPFVADFYQEPPLKTLLWILSASFFIGPMTSVPIGLWTRELNFQPIFIRTFIGAFVGGASSVTFVLLGYSFYSLAIGAILGMVSELIVTFIFSPKDTVWIPRFRRLPGLFTFGVYMSLTGMLSKFSEGITDLVIGRFNNTESVGIFSRGFGAVIFIKNLTENAVGPVVLPHLSEVKRSGGSVAEAYLTAISLLTVLIWPVMAVVSAAAHPMINLLFGDQWGLAVPLTSVLAFWAILTYAHYFGNAALIAVNHEKLMFQIGLVTFVFRLAIIIAVASQSLQHIAWAMVISGVFEAIVYVWALNRAIGLKLGALLRTLLPNAVLAACCWLVTKLIDRVIVFEEQTAMFSIAIVAPVLTLVWFGFIIITKHTALGVLLSLLPAAVSDRFSREGSIS